MPEQKYGLRGPGGDPESHRKRALLLLAQARDTHSPESRAEFERLAHLYERLAQRAQRRASRTSTLGALVDSYNARHRIPESEWAALIRAIAQRDQQAFQTLYVWTHRFVFAFLTAVTNDTFAAEAMTLRLFQDVWREAAAYDPAHDTVIAWIMNQARVRALDRQPLTFKETLLAVSGEANPDDSMEAIEGARKLQQSVTVAAFEEEPDMEEAGPGVFCKVLASDTERKRLSMLVRLAPGALYPPHTHADVEQLYLLRGELWIDGRKLYPGEYNCAQPGTA
ncbi:MAG: cupin domain-containing protein, partial [Gammaproteobacteria bacterium]|nr:cupin domain-containing protein [Gammaproteobacteria bacterium]